MSSCIYTNDMQNTEAYLQQPTVTPWASAGTQQIHKQTIRRCDSQVGKTMILFITWHKISNDTHTCTMRP
jgi:hypothetical protein